MIKQRVENEVRVPPWFLCLMFLDVFKVFLPISTDCSIWREIKVKAQKRAWRNMAVHNATQVKNLAKLYLKTAYPLEACQLGVISWPNIGSPSIKCFRWASTKRSWWLPCRLWDAWGGNRMSNHESNKWHGVQSEARRFMERFRTNLNHVQKPLKNWIYWIETAL